MGEQRSWWRTRTAARLLERLGSAGERLFRGSDDFARTQGWTVEVQFGGLGRRYRDPRFDRLVPCATCGGAGTEDNQPCPSCDGTGRIDLGQPSSAERRYS